MHVRFVPSIILLNKAALVEQYYRSIHADASAGNEAILEVPSKKVHLFGREPVSGKLLEKNVFFNDAAAPFLNAALFFELRPMESKISAVFSGYPQPRLFLGL